MFTTIVITLPRFIPREAERIEALLRSGRAGLVHIRKPGAAREEVEGLLRAIGAGLRARLALHDHFELAARYGLRGVHTNSRHPAPPAGFSGSVSRSCHSLSEVEAEKESYTFVSLSPVFDSISKRGYLSAFAPGELERARDRGLIDGRVYALGGVTFARLPEVERLGFGGAMILGDAWR